MSAKQLGQSLTHLNCQVPRLIGHDYYYLSDSTRKFKYTSPFNGEIIYSNDEILIANMFLDNGQSFLEMFEVPNYMNTSSLYATQLRYKRSMGPFSIGDILYEYDCFHNNIPTYGYNIWTAYMSFFGFNHEDATCISTSALNKMRSMKVEQVLIPVYEYSIFRNLYPDSPYKFIPAVGQTIMDTNVAFRNQIRTGNNIMNQLKSLNISELASLSNDDNLFNSIPITCRIPNAKVLDVRVHMMNNQCQLLDKSLEANIGLIRQYYEPKLREVVDSFREMFPKQYADMLLANNYVMAKKIKNDLIDKNQMVYLIEMTIGKDSESHFADKFANRYANKGVCSFLEITDELRPTIARTGQPIDFISGPITGVGRMNFGQFVEGCISKAIDNSEQIILKDESKISEELRKLSKISDVLSDHDYAQKIRNLANDIENNPNIKRQFMNSIHENGLYMEAPGFANCELQDLENTIYNETGIKVQEDIIIKKELIQYVNETLSSVSKKNLKLPTPNHDVVLSDIYCAPIYTLKLKQEAYYRSTSRDFGSYKSTNSQPVQGRSADGFIGASARLGQMELSLAPSYGNICVKIREFGETLTR